jgi:hypothetical protein
MKNRAQKEAFAKAIADLRRAAYAVADAWQNLEEVGEGEHAEAGYPEAFGDYADIVDRIDAWSRAARGGGVGHCKACGFTDCPKVAGDGAGRPVCPADDPRGRCADCGEPGERTGHMGCQYPQDHG